MGCGTTNQMTTNKDKPNESSQAKEDNLKGSRGKSTNSNTGLPKSSLNEKKGRLIGYFNENCEDVYSLNSSWLFFYKQIFLLFFCVQPRKLFRKRLHQED